MAISTVSTIILAVLVTPAIYILLSIFNYIRHTYAIIKAVKQWPGEPVHWLYGNMHQVIMVHNDDQVEYSPGAHWQVIWHVWG